VFKPTIKNGDEKQKKSINVLTGYSMRLERHTEEPPENHMQNQTFHRWVPWCGGYNIRPVFVCPRGCGLGDVEVHV
jgi:hypothetical protein